VSHHLKELRTAGLVTCEKQGQRVHCSVNWGVLEELQRFLAGTR
jgi:DNA-binding transcriptional ArsR family regulator